MEIYYSNEELKEVIKEALNTELGYDQLIDVTKPFLTIIEQVVF
jgi:hypothetical protein